MYDVLNNENSAFQYGAYLLALCNLVQQLEKQLNDYFGKDAYLLFRLIPTSGDVFCDSPLAFGFGLYTVQVQLICEDEQFFPNSIPTWELPFRASFGFTADTSFEKDWAIQHFHESINFEAIFGNLVQDILELEINVNAVTPTTSSAQFTLDATKLDDIVSAVDSATAANIKDQMSALLLN
jgi:hypothetical protein